MKRHASMNRIYRLIWSRVHNAWIAVAENSKGQGKSGRGKSALKRKIIVAALSLAFAPLAQANPVGAQVVNGAATINQVGNVLTVTNTPNTVINWQSFSIGSGQTTNFVQQSASSSVLNRVIGPDPSTLLGALTSNGKVFLINPAGILVGQGARIDVAGLVASTLNLSNSDFIAGKLNFGATPNAGIVQNNGTITTPEGGSVYLVAPQVENYGVINTPKGETILAAGNTVQLVDTGTPGVTVQVTGSSNAATNLGQILADSGQIGVVGAVVKNSGTISANSLVSQGGKIFLKASNSVASGGTISAQGMGGGNISVLADKTSGTVNVTGTLDASASTSGNGGFIETSAAHVNVANNANVTTAAPRGRAGTWLIDPSDFTIAATGGNMTGTYLSSQLGGSDVVILISGTPGNLYVNDVVTWSAHQLTLSASNNIYINANLNGSGTASLALEYGKGALAAGNASNYFLNNGAQISLPAGNNFSTLLGSDGTAIPYTVITGLGVAADATTAPSTMTLQGMAAASSLGGNYVLGSNIDASATGNSSDPNYFGSAGFTPIGNATTKFTGTLDGLGHTISTLTINQPATDNLGLFGYTDTGSVIRNVGLLGGSVSGTGSNYVGGLVGYNSGTVSYSSTTGSVSGAGNYVGGLVGYNSGKVSYSYAAGSVSGNGSNIGGLVGYNFGAVDNSYVSSNVSGTGTNVGGLVGNNDASGTVSNSYATGSVSGTSNVGGLVGHNYGTIDSSYATGSVSGSGYGGLVGINDTAGIVTNSFWNSSVNTNGIGVDNNSGVTTAGGLSTAQMQQQSNLDVLSNPYGLDFANTWVIFDGNTNPLLRSFMTPLTVTANNYTKTYNFSAYSGGNGVTYSVVYNSSLLGGTVSYGGTAQGAVNANSYSITPGGLHSYSQNGYLISYADGTLTVNPAPLTVTGTTVSDRAYNGTTAATLSGGSLNGVIAGDTAPTLIEAGVFASKNVGNNGVTATDSLSGTSAGNYTIVQPTGLTGNITQKHITVTAAGVNRVYNGTLNDAATLSSSGVVSGDVVNFADTSATFADKNVANGKAVTVSGITESGADAGNYILNNSTASTTANITAKSITVTATGKNRVYDGTLSDAATLSSTGVISGDVVNFADTSATFANKNVGTAKPVSVSGIMISGGADASNYTLSNSTASATANITPKPISVSATSGNMVYNGLSADTATVTLALTGLVSSDSGCACVNIGNSWAAAFADKNAGAGKTVTVSGITISGTGAGNYTLSSTKATTTANITPKTINAITATGVNKVYDGKLSGTATFVSSDVITHDIVNFSDTSATFVDKNAATGITLNISGIKISGTDAHNYTLGSGSTSATATANITPKPITVTAKGANMVYANSTTDTAAVTLASTGVIKGDVITFSDTSATFASKNAGNETLTVSGISISGGTNAGDYMLSSNTATTTAKITPKPITVSATSGNMVYDGLTADTAAITLASTGVFSGDVVNFGFTSANFANKNIGVGKTVTVSGINISGGTDAGNYKLSNTTARTTASITAH